MEFIYRRNLSNKMIKIFIIFFCFTSVQIYGARYFYYGSSDSSCFILKIISTNKNILGDYLDVAQNNKFFLTGIINNYRLIISNMNSIPRIKINGKINSRTLRINFNKQINYAYKIDGIRVLPSIYNGDWNAGSQSLLDYGIISIQINKYSICFNNQKMQSLCFVIASSKKIYNPIDDSYVLGYRVYLYPDVFIEKRKINKLDLFLFPNNLMININDDVLGFLLRK